MPKFVYTLKDEKGRDYQGIVEAKNKKEAQAKLDKIGYYLTSLKREMKLKSLLFSKEVSKTDVIVFSRQLATMIGAGIPIIKALVALIEQTENETLKTIINDMRSKIEGGITLSGAMERYPRVFSEFFISLIRTGEAGGILDEMLKRLSAYLEKEEDLRRKIKSAFAYPVVVSIVAIAVVTYLVIFVVPVFTQVYKGMRVELPGPTLVLIAISNIVRNWWLPLLIGIAGGIFAFRRFGKTKKGGFLIDKLKISLPLFGTLNKKVAVSRFVRSLGSLISSGIPITRALNVAESITANKVITKVIDRVRVAVNKGENIASSLKLGRVFPPVVVQMVAAGEESGALDDMLAKSADFLDEDIDMAIKKLIVRLEPLLTITLALVVGFIALAIYLPMFDIIRQISK